MAAARLQARWEKTATIILTTPTLIYMVLKMGSAWSSFVSLKGPQGSQGVHGPSGKTIISGSGAPSNTTGTDGDIYLDTANSIYLHLLPY
ncbi:hypothetical protein [Mastigocladopsis repens]|uniref:hypothetical protein n=1 Tax=Mastigocladopsis repens TaxID=221287 RepID=UPI000474C822|nr:hypothetical protein [Mastigocladopsis repens]